MKVKPEGLRGAANIYSRGGRHPLTAMFGADEPASAAGMLFTVCLKIKKSMI